MPETLPQSTGARQAPTRDRVTGAFARLHGISPEAAHSRIRKIEADMLGLVRFYSRQDAGNRIERLMVNARLAARPTGAIDCSDKTLRSSTEELHEADQRNDTARLYVAMDGPLPVEEETELRAIYAEMAELSQRAEILEARREARR